MVKLIIFDLDGVLVEAKNIHYEALNKALGKKYDISWNEHLSVYDGLKTVQKLNMLTKQKGLPTKEHNRIWEDKQKNTLDMLSDLKINHPFNTYIYNGLPPEPISYVGKKTLDILFENNKNDFLFYFFNYSLNKHIFSKSFKEHKEKLNEYRKK